MATQRVQFGQVLLAEMVLGAGDIIAQHDSGRLKKTYKVIDPNYIDAIGISTIFRPGASLDQLVQAGGPFPHSKISFAVVDTLITELDRVGYEPMLFVTPSHAIPDHHSLAVAQRGMTQPESELPDDAAKALFLAFAVVRNRLLQSEHLQLTHHV